MENQPIQDQTMSEKLNRRYWDIAFTYWLMFGAIIPAIILYLFIFAVGSILMISGIEVNNFVESALNLILKPIAIWLVIQFIASGFYIGKQRFLESKSKIINSAAILVIVLNLLLIAYTHIGGVDLITLFVEILGLALSVVAFYFASKKYLPSTDTLSNENLNDDMSDENKKVPAKNLRKIIFAIVILVIAYFSLSFLRINKATPELPNMQKVAEQFVMDIKNNDLQSANNLLVNDIKKSGSQEFLSTLSKSFDKLGGIKEYEITGQVIQSSGLKIYGNFNGQSLYGDGKTLPFIISVIKEDGQYKISNANFTLDQQEKSF
jgi:hypothetical protein